MKRLVLLTCAVLLISLVMGCTSDQKEPAQVPEPVIIRTDEPVVVTIYDRTNKCTLQYRGTVVRRNGALMILDAEQTYSEHDIEFDSGGAEDE